MTSFEWLTLGLIFSNIAVSIELAIIIKREFDNHR